MNIGPFPPKNQPPFLIFWSFPHNWVRQQIGGHQLIAANPRIRSGIQSRSSAHHFGPPASAGISRPDLKFWNEVNQKKIQNVKLTT